MKIYASISSVLVGLFMCAAFFVLSIFLMYECYGNYQEQHDVVSLIIIFMTAMLLFVLFKLFVHEVRFFTERKQSLFEFVDDVFYYRKPGSVHYDEIRFLAIESARMIRGYCLELTLTDRQPVRLMIRKLPVDYKQLMKGFEQYVGLQPSGADSSDLRRK